LKKGVVLKRITLILAMATTVAITVAASPALADTIVFCRDFGADGGFCPGTNNEDRIYGTGQDDWIFAYDDDDLVYGYRGDDTIYGGEGNDNVNSGGGLFGLDGDDTIYGGPGNDDLYGGNGNDRLFDAQARNDVDRAFGEGGRDRINVADNDSFDKVNCGSGKDKVIYDRGDSIKKNCENKNRG
jgi:Ca2+-binding RTX toxin-like protein